MITVIFDKKKKLTKEILKFEEKKISTKNEHYSYHEAYSMIIIFIYFETSSRERK